MSEDFINLFISYRRKSWPIVHLLEEKLKEYIKGDVFVDYTSIDDTDFEQSILRHLRESNIVLVVVTELTFSPDRISNDDDWVRREIALALKLNKPIVLILVDKQLPPPSSKLPKDIRDITRKQGIAFYPEYFAEAVQNLAKFVYTVLASTTSSKEEISTILANYNSEPQIPLSPITETDIDQYRAYIYAYREHINQISRLINFTPQWEFVSDYEKVKTVELQIADVIANLEILSGNPLEKKFNKRDVLKHLNNAHVELNTAARLAGAADTPTQILCFEHIVKCIEYLNLAMSLMFFLDAADIRSPSSTDIDQYRAYIYAYREHINQISRLINFTPQWEFVSDYEKVKTVELQIADVIANLEILSRNPLEKKFNKRDVLKHLNNARVELNTAARLAGAADTQTRVLSFERMIKCREYLSLGVDLMYSGER